MEEIKVSPEEVKISPVKPNKFPLWWIAGGVILLVLAVVLVSFPYYVKLDQEVVCKMGQTDCPQGGWRWGKPLWKVVLEKVSFFSRSTVSSEEAVFCGGWDPGGEIICGCSGQLIKPVCPSGILCDSGNYFCQGQCGSCCWRGAGDDVQYGGPYPRCNSDKFPDQVCELNKEYESNAVEGPDCQCPAGFQPEIVSMGMGPCPAAGARDCPASRFKCSKEKTTSGVSVEGKFCGGIGGNLPENQCPVGYRCQLDGNYPDASGKCVRE